jgi:hypothetical protein
MSKPRAVPYEEPAGHPIGGLCKPSFREVQCRNMQAQIYHSEFWNL